jgi:hypothetical protein
MKTLKVMAIIGMALGSIWIFGSFALLAEDPGTALIAIIVYGYFLALSIVAYLCSKDPNCCAKKSDEVIK